MVVRAAELCAAERFRDGGGHGQVRKVYPTAAKPLGVQKKKRPRRGVDGRSVLGDVVILQLEDDIKDGSAVLDVPDKNLEGVVLPFRGSGQQLKELL